MGNLLATTHECGKANIVWNLKQCPININTNGGTSNKEGAGGFTFSMDIDACIKIIPVWPIKTNVAAASHSHDFFDKNDKKSRNEGNLPFHHEWRYGIKAMLKISYKISPRVPHWLGYDSIDWSNPLTGVQFLRIV